MSTERCYEKQKVRGKYLSIFVPENPRKVTIAIYWVVYYNKMDIGKKQIRCCQYNAGGRNTCTARYAGTQ